MHDNDRMPIGRYPDAAVQVLQPAFEHYRLVLAATCSGAISRTTAS
jgi:gluconolactonase